MKSLNQKISLHGHGCPEPIGLEYIAGSLKLSGWKVEFVSNVELQTESGGKRLSFLSSISSDWERCLRLAGKRKSEGCIVIVGGYHASGAWQDVRPEVFDHIVVGEGEYAAASIVEYYSEKIGRITEPLGHVLKAKVIRNLDDLPFPLRYRRFLSRYKIFDLMWPVAHEQKNAAMVLTSRGCKYDCEFCASKTIWGRGLRSRSEANVIEELNLLKGRYGTNTIVIIDQSFGQNKEWTIKLCNAIENAKLNMSWYNQSNLSIHWDAVKAMASAGCTKIGFGMEGITPEAIDRIKPINEHDIPRINKLFDYCNSLGIFTKVYLIIGFPWEDERIISSYLKNIGKIRANEIKISFMTPFPGTKDWELYSKQLVTDKWEYFDTVQMPVVRNPHISVERYFKIREELFKAFYGSATYAEVTKAMVEKYHHYADSYREFINYLNTFNMISGNETWLGIVKERKS